MSTNCRLELERYIYVFLNSGGERRGEGEGERGRRREHGLNPSELLAKISGHAVSSREGGAGVTFRDATGHNRDNASKKE